MSGERTRAPKVRRAAGTPSGSVDPAVGSLLLIAVAGLYVAGFALAMQHGDYDTWGGFIVAPILVLLTVPVLHRFARSEPHSWTGRMLMAALLLKLLASLVRYQVAFVGYDGSADASRYHQVGAQLAQEFRNVDFSLAAMKADRVVGTGFIEILTGAVYTVTGPTLIGGFLVFSWIGFWGLFLFYRAFRVAVPDGDARRYGLLLFFLPSMLYWPSSIGKEAWMMLALGACAYGSALLLVRRRGAVPWLVAGLAATLVVRPHVTLVVVAGLAIAYALRGRQAAGVSPMGPIKTVVGLGVIAATTMLVLGQAAAFFGVDELNAGSATQVLGDVQEQTAQGGSAYAGSSPSLANLPMNLITVLFRPWPFEANNAYALISACEGTLLLLLFLASLPRLRSIPARIRSQPYVVLCVISTLLFCFMFSTLQNFGILTRERVQIYPFVLVLLALPVAYRTSKGVRGTATGREPREGRAGGPPADARSSIPV